MQEKQLLPTPRLRRAGIAESCKLIGKIEGRWTTVPLGRRKMEDGSKNNFSPQMDTDGRG